MAIYLLRSLRGDNLEEIGREFNITRFSSVSGVVERMRGKMDWTRRDEKGVEFFIDIRIVDRFMGARSARR